MKNLIILLSSLFIISCTSDPSPTSENIPTSKNTEGTILKSYKYTNTPDGSEHFFENNGTRYEKIIIAGSIFSKYIYDSNNKMTQIIYSPDDLNFTTTTSFFYNDKGQIVRMEKDRRKTGSLGKLSVWLFTYNNNVVTGELVPDTDPNFKPLKVSYTFNNEGLLVSRQDYINKATSTSSYLTLKYDDKNKNVISLKITKDGTHDLPDSPINLNSYTTTYEYDDKINPIHQIYMNHYMNYILSNEYPFNIEGGSLQDRVLGTGTNNLKRTIYPIDISGGIPVDNVYINNYIYQLNNLPKKTERISTVDNKEYSNIIYNYITK
jgi:hypothetical protein